MSWLPLAADASSHIFTFSFDHCWNNSLLRMIAPPIRLSFISRQFPEDTELFNLGDSQLGSQMVGIRLSKGIGRRSNRRITFQVRCLMLTRLSIFDRPPSVRQLFHQKQLHLMTFYTEKTADANIGFVNKSESQRGNNL